MHITIITTHHNNNAINCFFTNFTAWPPFTKDTPDLKIIELSKTPDGKDIRLIDHLALHWKSVGRQLGIEETTLAAIEKSNLHHEAAIKMLNYWINSDASASWSKLLSAMRAKKELSTVAQTFQSSLIHYLHMNKDEL